MTMAYPFIYFGLLKFLSIVVFGFLRISCLQISLDLFQDILSFGYNYKWYYFNVVWLTSRYQFVENYFLSLKDIIKKR